MTALANDPHAIPAKIGNCAHCGGECLLLRDAKNCVPCNFHGKPGKDGTCLIPKKGGING